LPGVSAADEPEMVAGPVRWQALPVRFPPFVIVDAPVGADGFWPMTALVSGSRSIAPARCSMGAM